MGLFGDVMGYIDTGRAAKSISDANIAAEHGVLGATGAGQSAISSQLGTNTSRIDNAGADVNTATASANGSLQDYLKGIQGNLAPAIQSGAQGNQQLQDYAKSNPQFHAPTAAEVQATPGYQFQLQAGSDALTNQASARGLSQGGGTLAALTQYGQGLAGTYYQNAFNNAQSQFQTNQNSTLANLSALIGSGATANGQNSQAVLGLGGQQAQNTIGAANTNATLQQYLAGLNTQGTETGANLGLQGARTAGDFAVGAGTAHASGIIGQGAALTQGVGDLAGLITQIPGLGGH